MRSTLLVTIVVLMGATVFASQSFGETLADAWLQVLANNRQLAAQQCETAASDAELQASRALRKPSGTLRGSYNVLSDEPSYLVDNPLAPPGLVGFPYSQNEYAATEAVLSAPLYTSGKNKYSILRAEAGLIASQHELRRTRLDLMLSVGEAYIGVLRAQREMEVAESDLSSRQAHRKEVENLFRQERSPRTELLTAEVTLATAVQNRLRILHHLEVMRANYNRILARPLLTPFALEEVSLPGLVQSLGELESGAMNRRPEITQLQAASDARLFEARRLEAANLPQVNAVGSHRYMENRFQEPNGIAVAAVVVDWAPLDGGRSKYAAQAERSRATALFRQLEDLKSHIALELLTRWNERQEAFERRDVTLRAVQQADENLRVLEMRYSQGLALQSDLLDAQTRRTTATRAYYNAVYDQTTAELRLRHASGLLEYTDLTPSATSEALPAAIRE